MKNSRFKFRAWAKESKNMLSSEKLKEMQIFALSESFSGDIDNFLILPIQDKYPLMQFTGLLDKNDVEIYERDIVIADCRNYNENQLHYIIEYDNINTCFFGSTDRLKNNKYKIGLNQPMADIRQNIEVIGNIYENPELLECNKDAKC